MQDDSKKNKEENTASEAIKKTTKNKRSMMLETPVPKLIIKLAIPTIISMLVTAFYNSVDTYFVGKISTNATAAVGLVFSVMAIIQAMGFFCGHGSGNYLARMLGAKKYKEANHMASTGFALSLLLGLILAIGGNIFLKPLAILIGADSKTMKDTMDYMRIILMGAPFMMGQFVINNQLRFQGNAMYAMVGLMCGAFFNVVMDPILILGLHMGVSGAAIATITGQTISFFVLLNGLKKGENIRLHIYNINFSPKFFLEITNGGLPSLLRQGLSAIAVLLLNKFAGKYGGVAAIAGMSIVTRVTMMVCSAIIGFGQGYQPVCSYNFGANKKNRVKEGYFFCIKWGSLFLLVMGTLCFIFAPQIIRWFRDDDAVVAVGKVALRCQAVALPFMIVIFITNMMLQSIGSGLKASIAASARSGLFFVPLILILPHFFGLLGVEITQTCADVLSIMMAIPFAYSELRKMN